LLQRSWFRRRRENNEEPSVEDLFAYDETKLPSHQNAVDAVPGWSCHFPTELGLQAGALPAFADNRIAWAIAQYGDLRGRLVMELGPLEAAHTYMLAEAGAHVDAVESNRLAYFKCLVTREVMGFPNARFYLGDCVQWLEQTDKRYDLIVASGVLYHMREPTRLLKAMAERTDAIYLWTVMVDDETAIFLPSNFEGLDVRLYPRGYGGRGASFCGGSMDYPNWLHRDDILAVLKALGFEKQTIAHEGPASAINPVSTFSVFATRGRAQ
jgi:hypothetical protein